MPTDGVADLDTSAKAPLRIKTDLLIIGGTCLALTDALKYSKRGRSVTLVITGTSLCSDITQTEHYFFERELAQEMMLNDLFPAEVWMDDSESTYRILHPGKLKLHTEKIALQSSITLLYQSVFISFHDRYAFIAGKAGITAIHCNSVLDYRCTDTNDGQYIINIRCRLITGEVPSSHNFKLVKAADDTHYYLAVATQNSNNPGLEAIQCLASLKETYTNFEILEVGRFALEVYFGLSTHCTAVIEHMCSDPVSFYSCNPMLDDRTGIFIKPQITIDETVTTDVVIAGGGTSGAFAAIECARQGLKTILIESQPQLGGTSTVGGVYRYWYGNEFEDVKAFEQDMDELYKSCNLTRERGPWGKRDVFNPGFRSSLLLKHCRDFGVQLLSDHTVFGCCCSEEDCVYAVVASNGHKTVLVKARTVIDATGDADLVNFLGGLTTYGSERDGITFWASLAHYPDPVAYENNFTTMHTLGDPLQSSQFITRTRSIQDNLYDRGSYIAHRESRHCKAVTTITLKDILSARTFPDGVCTCFSNYDPKGLSGADCLFAGFLVPPMAFTLPFSALIPLSSAQRPYKGILVIGKAFGATHDAFPGLRMQRDLMHLGVVAALACTIASSENIDVSAIDINRLQQMVKQRTSDPLTGCRPLSKDPTSLVASISGQSLKEWTHLPFTQMVERASAAHTALTLPSEEVCPALALRYSKESDRAVRLLLAQILLFHGDTTGLESILDSIKTDMQAVGQEGLPRRNGSLLCVQMLPDHAVMAETIHNLNLLAWCDDERTCDIFATIADRILHMERDFEDNGQSLFYYIYSFAYVAERCGHTSFIELLHRLLTVPEFYQPHKNAGLHLRMELLKLLLYRALARLGDIQGYLGLIDFLDHEQRSLAHAALRELQSLTNSTVGFDAPYYRSWCEKHRSRLKIQKILTKTW